jgi:hypothetical protein
VYGHELPGVEAHRDDTRPWGMGTGQKGPRVVIFIVVSVIIAVDISGVGIPAVTVVELGVVGIADVVVVGGSYDVDVVVTAISVNNTLKLK